MSELSFVRISDIIIFLEGECTVRNLNCTCTCAEGRSVKVQKTKKNDRVSREVDRPLYLSHLEVVICIQGGTGSTFSCR